ncbi:hypothetical protein FKG94_21580 [Exilibacterium tricleocarpae]|uniref:Porin n=1 Tax=Exilibacterium tricleocarpae TaxID=2591008 RepID=A0A545SYS8_9GAMM|nr:porin [Exilibacterium tricleocarpae]TQV70121.1 hypothetical protein FKG94_21580 [Exilibacterium tricleocarpae]
MHNNKHRGLRSLPTLAASAGLVCLSMVAGPVAAGKRLDLDDTRWISVGAGLRAAYTSVEDGAPSGDARSNDFDVQNMRLYFSGQLHENIKFTFNTDEIFSDGPVDVLDAIAQFEFSKGFNLWVGRMLTPADRIEMNGPFYGLTWNQYTQPLYPSDQGGAAGTYGRDDGITLWGAAGKFQYAIGAFDGVQGFGNHDDELLFAGRFAYNFLNMEDNPAYYTSSTYYGGLGNVLTLGLSFQSQSGATGSFAESGDFSGYTVDLLSETALDSGAVVTVEAEYKDFDADFTLATLPAGGGGCFCLFDGDSYFVTAAYLFAQETGVGKLQPYVRVVENSPTDAADSDLTEVGLNYVISGHNARLNFNYSSGDANITGYPGADVDSFSFGVQWQI